MRIDFDPAKNRANLAKHGLDFNEVLELDWSTAITSPDRRFAYGEHRYITYVSLYGRLHCLAWTARNGAIRPISFRKANAKERKKYEKEI